MADDAWRCDGCGKLIYNWDSSGKPIDGAPDPKHLSTNYKSVCSVCFDMGSVIRDSMYWNRLAEEHAKRFGQLRPGGNYYPGA